MKKYRKLALTVLAGLLAAAPLAACGNNDTPTPDPDPTPVPTDVEVTEVKCTEDAVNLTIGDTHKLTTSVLPENATNKTLTYTSSKAEVASVSNDGTITALKKGTTLITIKSNNDKSVSVAVSVAEQEIKTVDVTSIDVDATSLSFKVNETHQIVASALPENATNKNLEYFSDSKNVAKVDQKGLITGVSEGTAIITVRSQSNPDIKREIEVTVLTNIVGVTDITITKTLIELHPTQTETIEYTVLPENATNKDVNFFIQTGEDVCTVSSSGLVTATKEGVATVVVQSKQNGAIFKVVNVYVENVHNPVSEINVVSTSMTIEPGESNKITYEVLPENATNKDVLFSSNAPEVATVDNEGNVLGVSEGDASITVSSVDNPAAFKVINVKVQNEIIGVKSIVINEEDVTIDYGDLETVQLTVTVDPTGATNPAVEWSSDNVSVASVNINGVVIVKGCGVAVITATSVSNRDAKDTFKITVGEVLAESVEIKKDGEAISKLDFSVLDIGDDDKLVQLSAAISPENTTNKALIWESSNPAVASVSPAGLVTPLSEGATVITVTNTASNKKDTITVNVEAVQVSEIIIKKDGSEISKLEFDSEDIESSVTLTATVLPENATHKEITWYSTDESVVSVEEGVVTVNGCGNAYIGVVSDDNIEVSKNIEVHVGEIMVSSIELRLNDNAVSEYIFASRDIGKDDKKIALQAVVNPGNAYDKDIEWDSMDTKVATVTDGVVAPTGIGDTEIIATNIKSGKRATLKVKVISDEYILVPGGDVFKGFQNYRSNIAEKPENRNEEFYIRDNGYKVGSDNRVKLLPEIQVVDKTFEPVDASLWAFDYSINVQEFVGGAYADADAKDYNVLSNRTCDLKFNESAEGKSFKVTIQPGGMDYMEFSPAEKESTTFVYEFDVVKGYNVYNAVEFSYFDTTTVDTYKTSTFSYMFSGETKGQEGGMKRTSIDWPLFKRQHNLDDSESHSILLLQDNIRINKDSVPSSFFYSEQEAADAKWTEAADRKSIGTMKDYCYLYVHNTTTTAEINGNYFKIDFEDIPLIQRTSGKRVAESGKVESHAAFLKAVNGNVSIKNLNAVGNSHSAQTDEDIKYAGGLFFIKASDKIKKISLDNMLTHWQYITAMSEGVDKSEAVPVPTEINISDLKATDHYNTFLYNWGGKLNVKHSLFEQAGGPVLIQDHTGVNTDTTDPTFDHFETNQQTGAEEFKINGYAPESVFKDCIFNNYVVGSEAWFVSFEAQATAPIIKTLSDSIGDIGAMGGQGFTKTFLTKGATMKDRTPVRYDQEPNAEMNFIILNKSGSAEGMTSFHVDGSVKFEAADGSTKGLFDYMKPHGDSLSNPNWASEKSIYNNRAGYSFREQQRAGNPVVQTNNVMSPDTREAFAIDMSTHLPAPVTGSSLEEVVASVLYAGDYVGVYYNGMLLIFTLYNIAC